MFDNGSLAHIQAMPGCYRIYCLAWDRAYIGSTSDLAKRFLQHRDDLRRQMHQNTWLQRAFNKLGPVRFYFQVLEISPGKFRRDALAPAEQRWMNLHPRIFNRRLAGSDDYILATSGNTRVSPRGKTQASLSDAKAGGGPLTPQRGTTRPLGRKLGRSK